MNNKAARDVKGKLSWVVPVLEVILIIVYFILGWSAISDFISSFDIDSLFKGVEGAIYFLIGGTIVTTVMCFIPVFKSKNNTYIAVWNIVWLGFNLYGLFTN